MPIAMNRPDNSVCLVIGATGFIGAHMVRRLLEAGLRTRVFVRSPHKLRDEFAGRVEIVAGSLCDEAPLQRAVEGAAIVFNCAGLSADWGRPQDFQQANIAGLSRLLEAVKHSGCSRLMHLSTTDVYGYPETPCDERTPLRDVKLPYNSSKVAGDRLVQEAIAAGLPATILRPAQVWGPGSDSWVVEICRLLLAKSMLLIDGGRSGAGLIYVSNLVEIMFELATDPRANGLIINICDQEHKTWAEYVAALQGLLWPHPTRRFSLPGRLAHAIGHVMEMVFSATSSSRRPLLTRHAVNLLWRDQNYDTSTLRPLVAHLSLVPYDLALSQTAAWLDSPEGRAKVPRPGLSA